MLTVEIVVAVVVVGLVVAVVSRRRSHDDVHSVEGYHRQLHTLEHITVETVKLVSPDPGERGAGPATPPAGEPAATAGVKPAFPESAVRVAGTPTVRLTDGTMPPAPPVPHPPVADPTKPVTFDDAGHTGPGRDRESPAPGPGHERHEPPAPPPGRPGHGGGRGRRAHRGPAAHRFALARRAHHPPAAATGSGSRTGTTVKSATKSKTRTKTGHTHHSTTTTTAPPIVSLPRATSVHEATYHVAADSFTLMISATTGSCWVDATDATSGTSLFTGVMTPGQQKTIAATGPVNVEVGAPTSFAGTVDGTAFVLPYGFQTPFTLQFVPTTPAGSTATTTTTAPGSTAATTTTSTP